MRLTRTALAVALATVAPATAAENVIWTNAVGVSVTRQGLTKLGPPAWDAGAMSTRAIAAGDGWVEVVAGEANTARMFGLSHGETNQSYGDIDFALFMRADSHLFAYESGLFYVDLGAYGTGDKLRVAVEAGAVRYRKNGILLYTSTVAPRYPLLVDSALYSTGATLTGAVIQGALVPNVSWTHVVNAVASGNNLAKLGPNDWDGGAVSKKAIVSGDGYVEFDAPDVGSQWMAGLGTGDTSQDYGDIEYAVYISGDLYGVSQGQHGGTGWLGYFASGDRFRVAVESGVVKFYRNGVLFYVSPYAPQYPLVLDTALWTQGAGPANAVISGQFAPNQLPVADPGSGYLGTAGLPLRFSGAASSDADGDIAAYEWDFGDGTTASGAAPQHVYASAGTFTVKLTVTDEDGASTTAGVSVPVTPPLATESVFWTHVVNAAPSGGSLSKLGWESNAWDSGAVSRQTINGNGYVEFTVPDVWNIWMAGLGNGDTGTDYWDIEYALYFSNSADFYVVESGQGRGYMGSYAAGDRFRIAVESGVVRYYRNGALIYESSRTPQYPLLLDTALHTAATQYTPAASLTNAVVAFVANQAPLPNAGGPYSGRAQQPVAFNGAASTDLDGAVVSYQWDFGDGASASGVAPSHAYAAQGTYTASLTVTDNGGATATATASVLVSPPNRPPVVDAGGPYAAFLGQTVLFQASGSDPDGDPISYRWELGDGATATGPTTTHTYTAPADYAVRLTVADSLGASSLATTPAFVRADDDPSDPGDSGSCCLDGQESPHMGCVNNQCVEIAECGVSDCNACPGGGGGGPCDPANEEACIGSGGQWDPVLCSCNHPCNPGPAEQETTPTIVETRECVQYVCGKASVGSRTTYYWVTRCQDGTVHERWQQTVIAEDQTVDDPNCLTGCNPCDPDHSKEQACLSSSQVWKAADCTCHPQCDPDGSQQQQCTGQWNPADCRCTHPNACDLNGNLRAECAAKRWLWNPDNCECKPPSGCDPQDEIDCHERQGRWNSQTCTCDQNPCQRGVPTCQSWYLGEYDLCDYAITCRATLEDCLYYCWDGTLIDHTTIVVTECKAILPRTGHCL